MQAIVDAEPARPSERLSFLRNSARLRGDLDNIVLKALKKSAGGALSVCRSVRGRSAASLESPTGQRTARLVRVSRWKIRGAQQAGCRRGGDRSVHHRCGAAVSVWEAVEATRQRDRALSLAAATPPSSSS
jgi:hypothetical protein